MALESKPAAGSAAIAAMSGTVQVSQLSADVVEALLGKCSVVQGAVVGRLLALRANGNDQGRTHADTATGKADWRPTGIS